MNKKKAAALRGCGSFCAKWCKRGLTPFVSFFSFGALGVQEVNHFLEVLLSVHCSATVAAIGYAYYVALNTCLLHLVIQILAYA